MTMTTKTFNRTSLESKQVYRVRVRSGRLPFNRTSLESKRGLEKRFDANDIAFNRTSLESKQSPTARRGNDKIHF